MDRRADVGRISACPAADSEPDWSGLTAVVRGHMASPDDFFTPEAAQGILAKLGKR